MAGEKHHLHIELTPEEYETLCAKAKASRLTKREFIVRLVKGEEIKGLRKEVHQIGNNINQIARSVNAGIASAEDARRALSMLDRIYELMYEIAKE